MTERIVFNKIKREWDFLTPQIIEDGKKWYPEAHDFCKELSKKYSLAITQTSGICSSLSPLKSWELNKRLTKDFLEGKEYGHFKHQIEKARKIKRISIPSTIDKILKGNKTVNFFRNINNPTDNQWVTVDSHLLKYVGDGVLLNSTNYRYNLIKNSIIKYSKYVNLQPNEVQAIIWLRAKELYGNDI